VILSTSNSTRSMMDSIQGLRPDGRLVAIGADAEPLSISLLDLITKRIRVIGSQQNGPEYLYEALDFVAQGKVKNDRRDAPIGRGTGGVRAGCGGQGPVPSRPHNVIAEQLPQVPGGSSRATRRERSRRHLCSASVRIANNPLRARTTLPRSPSGANATPKVNKWRLVFAD
jgi:hypothetical protein